MDKSAKVYVAGHRGLVGSAIVRKLKNEGYSNLILRGSDELDLRNQAAVASFFDSQRPDYVFLAAAKVGGIIANSTMPAEFSFTNLMIQCNVIHQAWVSEVKKLLFLGSTCIYPKYAQQPIREEYLLTGPLEPTNEAYAIAKIAGISLCRSFNRQYGTRFISAMPTNIYGPNDNFDLETSHVLPALLRKFHEAKLADAPEVIIWGSGSPFREFVHVDDVADACLFLMERHEVDDIFNIGSGQEISIKDLAFLIKEIVGYTGEVVFDTGKPDGTPRKLCELSRLHELGWRHKIKLNEGTSQLYGWYLSQISHKGIIA
jgi:GDP-L-fucose synthase